MNAQFFSYLFYLCLIATFTASGADNINLIKQGDNADIEQKQTPITIDPYFYITTEDDKSFTKAVVDKRTWSKRYFGGLPLADKNVWVQVGVNISHQSNKNQGLLIMMVASYQAYWDGQFIGSNGLIGTSKDTERAGQIEFGIGLSKHQVMPGRHTLSLKVSSHHNNSKNELGSFYIFSGDYPQVAQFSNKSAMLPLAMSGALLLLAVYCLLLYFSAIKNVCYLLFSGLCLMVLLLFIAESWRGLWGYSYDWHIARLMLILGLTFLVSVLLTAFFAFFFKLTSRQRNAIILGNVLLQTGVLLIVPGYDIPSLYLIFIAIVTSSLPCGYAALTKQKNAWLMLSALVVFIVPLVMNTRLYMEQFFFVSFAILISLMLYSLTQTMRIKQQQLVQSQINASRLELELVKRNLQPHFILNTLTAVEEWIEENPAVAVAFIDALADEFRLMAKISCLPLVSLVDEIAMCRAHLHVMEFRSNTKFEFRTKHAGLTGLLPPGILLTLVENAISHNRYQQQNIVFIFNYSEHNSQCRLTFIAPISQSIGGHQAAAKAINAGIGSKYIEARLKESFAQNWTFISKKTASQWQADITLPLRLSGEQQGKCK